MTETPAPASDNAGSHHDEPRVALLRGVNVGGRASVAMADLREMLAALGFAEPRSLLQSGNLVFRGDGRPNDELERLLEEETARRLDLRTEFFVRTPAEWQAVVDGNPFPDEAERDPGHLVAMFLKASPGPNAVEALQASIAGPEVVSAGDRCLYIVYPDGIGRSKLTNTAIEMKLATRGTARNWNTVLKLAALVLP